MKKQLLMFLALFLMIACSKQSTSYENIEKNDLFFKEMTTKVSGNFVPLSNGVTYYEELNPSSTKGTLVFVHGFSVPSYIWSPSFETAAQKGYRVIRMDLYGRGYSENPTLPYTDELLAKQVLELLDYLNIEKATFIGLSNGGRVISKIAYLNKDIIERLIYVASSGFQEKTPFETINQEISQEEITAFINNYPAMAKSQSSDFKNPDQFPGWVARYEELLQYKGFAYALISTRKNHTTMDIEHQMIHETGIPVYTLFGDSDSVVIYDRFKDRIMNLLPNRNEIFISNSGHLPHMENQKEFERYLFETILN